MHTLYATMYPKSDALVAIGQFQCKLKTLLASVLYLFYLICLFPDVLAWIWICLVVLVDFSYFCVRWSRMEAVAVCVWAMASTLSQWFRSLRVKLLQRYEHQPFVSCLAGLYGCQWKHYKRSQPEGCCCNKVRKQQHKSHFCSSQSHLFIIIGINESYCG